MNLAHLASMSESNVISWEVFVHVCWFQAFSHCPKNLGRDPGMRFADPAKGNTILKRMWCM